MQFIARGRDTQIGGVIPQSRGEFTQPTVQNLELIFGGFDKHHAHAHPFLNVNNLTFRLKRALVACDPHIQIRSLRQGHQHVDVTSLSTDFRNPSGDAHVRSRLAQFDVRDERESRDFTMFWERTAGIRRRARE